jgi:anti-anti-sigma factor
MTRFTTRDPPHPVHHPSLTEANADEFGRELDALARAARPDLVLDLAAVEFLSSAVLTRLLGLDRQLRAGGGRLSLVNLRPMVREVFAMTRLDDVLEVWAADETPAPTADGCDLDRMTDDGGPDNLGEWDTFADEPPPRLLPCGV